MDQDKVLDKVESQVETIAIRVVSVEEKLDTFSTGEEMGAKFDEVLNGVDRFVKLHETLDQALAA